MPGLAKEKARQAGAPKISACSFEQSIATDFWSTAERSQSCKTKLTLPRWQAVASMDHELSVSLVWIRMTRFMAVWVRTWASSSMCKGVVAEMEQQAFALSMASCTDDSGSTQ